MSDNKRLEEFKARATTTVDLAYRAGQNDEVERVKLELEKGRQDTVRLNKFLEISEKPYTYNEFNAIYIKKIPTDAGTRYCVFINGDNQGIWADTPREAIDEFIEREDKKK